MGPNPLVGLLRVRSGGAPGQVHTLPRHLDLRPFRTPGEHLDLGPVRVPRREIGGREPGCGAENFVHQTHVLEELEPVDGRHPTHAGDDVSNGDIRRGLGMVFQGNHLLRRCPLGAQLSVEPVHGWKDRRPLVTKPLDELHGKGTAELGVSQRAQDFFHRLHGPTAQAQQTVRQLVGRGSSLPRADDQLGQPPQVLHQGDAEVDGNRPELPDGERLATLIGAHESLQRLQFEPAVGMGHVGPGQPVDSRVSREVALGDFRQPAVVAPREVVPDPPDLFLHNVEVVEEPLRGGGDLAFLPHRLGNVAVSGQKHLGVVPDPREKVPSLEAFGSGALCHRQALSVLLQALDAEDLGADRFFPEVRSDNDGFGGVHFRAFVPEYDRSGREGTGRHSGQLRVAFP